MYRIPSLWSLTTCVYSVGKSLYLNSNLLEQNIPRVSGHLPVTLRFDRDFSITWPAPTQKERLRTGWNWLWPTLWCPLKCTTAVILGVLPLAQVTGRAPAGLNGKCSVGRVAQRCLCNITIPMWHYWAQVQWILSELCETTNIDAIILKLGFWIVLSSVPKFCFTHDE